MGNSSSAEDAKGAGKDVIQQTDKSSNTLYDYVDLNGGGKLVEIFRKAQCSRSFREVEKLIGEFGQKYLYNNGEGKDVEVEKLVKWRAQTREVQQESKQRNLLNVLTSFFTKYTNPVKHAIEAAGSDNYGVDEVQVSEVATRHVCWDVNQRAAVGENILHLCFLNATRVHYDLAKMIIQKYPMLVNDVYLSDEFYGESLLHMAIVNENLGMVHCLCNHGANIHERAYGAFFCPEDQRHSRRDIPDQEDIILDSVTNYQSNTYWGEYPLSFAASLGLEDMVRYLLVRGACPNKQDTNGNTVLHMMVIHDQVDMYDLILGYQSYCGCCEKPLTDIKNKQGLTPLTLAAKLARKEMFDHILTLDREVFWKYGNVTCAAFSLRDIDTVTADGRINEDCVLNIITYEESASHLVLFEGILYNLLKEKWRHTCRYRFYLLLALYILFLITFSIALYLRPFKDPGCNENPQKNASVSYTFSSLDGSGAVLNVTSVAPTCDPCFLISSVSRNTTQKFRAAFEIVALTFAVAYIFIIIREMIIQGVKSVFLGMFRNPLRFLFLLSCILLLTCLVARFTCKAHLEDHLTVAALIISWPYSLAFCRGFSLVGPFVVMIYRMLKRDFLIFFVIYVIFVIGFSQAMYLVMTGFDDNTKEEQLFTRWFASGLGLIILSLGEFEDLYGQVVTSNSPFKVLGLKYFVVVVASLWNVAKGLGGISGENIMFFLFIILGALLIVNMLIAMMGNTYLAVAETEKEWTRQWARIVLATERMLTPKQRLATQKIYSQNLASNGERALIMRLRTQEDREQSKVSNDLKQQVKANRKTSAPTPKKGYDWLDKNK